MSARTATPTIESEILEQERAYFAALERKDAATVAKLTTDECIVLGEYGVRRIDAQAAGDMAKQHEGKTTHGH